MRLFTSLPFALALCLPAAAMGQTQATSIVTEVTVFPQGAEVTRKVTVDLAAGENEVVIADLPAGLVAEALRVLPPKGVSLGASTLQPERPMSARPTASPDRLTAEAALDSARSDVAATTAAVDLVLADIAAAEARAAFAQSVRLTEAGATPAVIRDTAAAIGAEVAAAAQAAVAARNALPPLQKAQAEAALALTRAEAVLAALPAPPASHAILSVALEADSAGKVDLVIRHFVGDAFWTPVHDWHLTTGDVPTLRLDRAASVQQNAGEDWSEVMLTLSTAQPGRDVSPRGPWPQRRQVVEPQKEAGYALSEMETGEMGGSIEPVMEVRSAAANFQGDIVT